MGDMIDRDAVLAEIAKEGLHILDAAIRALPAADARAEALKRRLPLLKDTTTGRLSGPRQFAALSSTLAKQTVPASPVPSSP